MSARTVQGLESSILTGLSGVSRGYRPAMPKIHVLLYGLKSCGLIVPHPSGIVYRNQVAGGTCRQHSLEGIFVPVDWDDAAGAMEDIFFGGNTLSPEDADRIDAKLVERSAWVNRSKLSESYE